MGMLSVFRITPFSKTIKKSPFSVRISTFSKLACQTGERPTICKSIVHTKSIDDNGLYFQLAILIAQAYLILIRTQSLLIKSYVLQL